MYIASPIINITHQDGTFLTNEKPTLIYPNNPKFTVYLMIYS